MGQSHSLLLHASVLGDAHDGVSDVTHNRTVTSAVRAMASWPSIEIDGRKIEGVSIAGQVSCCFLCVRAPGHPCFKLPTLNWCSFKSINEATLPQPCKHRINSTHALGKHTTGCWSPCNNAMYDIRNCTIVYFQEVHGCVEAAGIGFDGACGCMYCTMTSLARNNGRS